MRSPAVLFGVLTVIAVLGSVALIQDPNNSSPYFLASRDPSALAFGASVNATDISQNQTLRVDVSVRNNLGLGNTVPLSGDWKVQNLTMGPCSFYEYYPYGIAVYQGRFTRENISSGTQVEIYAPGFTFAEP